MPALPPHISRLHAVFVQWLPYLEIHSACGSSWIHSLLACGLRAEGMGAFSSGPTTAPPGLTSEMDNRGMNGDSPDSRFGVMPLSVVSGSRVYHGSKPISLLPMSVVQALHNLK